MWLDAVSLTPLLAVAAAPYFGGRLLTLTGYMTFTAAPLAPTTILTHRTGSNSIWITSTEIAVATLLVTVAGLLFTYRQLRLSRASTLVATRPSLTVAMALREGNGRDARVVLTLNNSATSVPAVAIQVEVTFVSRMAPDAGNWSSKANIPTLLPQVSAEVPVPPGLRSDNLTAEELLLYYSRIIIVASYGFPGGSKRIKFSKEETVASFFNQLAIGENLLVASCS